MAESIVTFALDKVSSLLINEADFLSNVKEDVERLQFELKRMQSLLKDADRIQDQNERVRIWVYQIRDIAYDAEDVIDEFLLNNQRREARFRKFSWILKLLRAPQLHDIGTKINSIRAKIGDIYSSMQMAGIKFVGEAEGSTSTSEMRRQLRRSYPEDMDEHVIKLENSTKDVLAQLMQQDDELRVVSIVGMGGLGKTTLAKQIYNRNDVKEHFDCYSWVFLSQQFSPMDVLLRILKDIGQSIQSTREEELMKALNNALKGKRYLVVLDDIWKEEAWDRLKRAFPCGKPGSKVLFTTRIKEVALHANPWSSPVEPRFLTVEEGWELLSKKAFPREVAAEKSYAPQLEHIGNEMVRKLEGLPLAIAVLGGLLANKSITAWEKVQRDVNAQFTKLQRRNQYAGVEWILALSYEDLPFHLKQCFLNLSQFPEDSEFRKRRLIRMWLAEGFIPQGNEEETMEDIGEEYLEELISRSMVQVSERDHTGTGTKKCRMHDLMRS